MIHLPHGKTLKKGIRLLVNTEKLPFYFLLSYLITLTVECFARRSILEGFLFPFENPFAFIVNYGIILMSLLATMLGRRRVAWITLISLFWIGLGVAEFVLLSFRVTPLTAVDFGILPSVLSIITIYLSPFEIVLIASLLVLAIAAIIFLFFKVPKHKIALKKTAIALFFALCGFFFSTLLGMQTEQIATTFPNLANAYKDYGFAYCFSMSVFDKGIDEPDNYSKEEVDKLLATLPERNEPPKDIPNVIVVQLESLFDVNRLNGITFTEDPLPTYTALRKAYQSGLLTVPVIGAGTVNTEFEVLTGMNVLDFGAGEYPYKSILKKTTCESLAYTLSEVGLTAHAIHNHQGTFYARNEVYQNLGFSSFTPIELMLDPIYNETQWAKDQLLTGEIEQALQSTEGRDFIFTVSVQGHGKYPTDYLPKENDILITEGLEDDPEKKSQYTYYVNQLKETDAFIKSLYESVMASDEPTVLLFYGDHLPALSIDDTMLTSGTIYQTEYLFLQNFETEQNADKDLFTYELYPMITESIGVSGGIISRFHQSHELTKETLADLKLLSYDILYGEHYAGVSPTTYPKMTDMTIGTRPITISDHVLLGNTLFVTGENFTPFSVVTLDGKEYETTYLGKTILKVELDDTRDPFTAITVRQNNEKGQTLSESKPYLLRRSEYFIRLFDTAQ